MSTLPPFQNLERRVQRTITDLYDAFVDLLQYKHFKTIKVKDVTNKAKINRTTFYNHFSDMDDFIVYCAREGLRRELLSIYPTQEFPYARKNLELLVYWLVEFIEREYNNWHYKWDESIFENAMRTELYHYLVDWIPNNDVEKSLSLCNTTAMFISTSVVGLALNRCIINSQEPTAELSGKICQLLWEGLRKEVDP